MEVYILTCNVTGKRYVGKSANPKYRWNNGRGYKTCPLINEAIQRYGWDNFTHEVLLTGLTKDEAKEREDFYIALFRTTDPRYGYNKQKKSGNTRGSNTGLDSYSKEYRNNYHYEYMRKFKEEHGISYKTWSRRNKQNIPYKGTLKQSSGYNLLKL